MDRTDCTEEEGEGKHESALYLDLDGVATIFLPRFPTRALLNCRQVCKSWKEIISGVDFHRTRMDLKNRSEMLIRVQCSYNILELGVDEPLKLSFEYNLPNRYMLFVGSAHGLVCFFDYKINRLYISNPILGEFFAVPEFLTKSQPKSTAYGFGSADMVSYKILRVKSKSSMAELYTMGEGTWKNIGKAPFPDSNRCGACVHGNLHWIVEDTSFSDVICSFDIERAVFGSVQLPSFLKGRSRKYMVVETIRDTLFVFYRTTTYMHIFSMKEYGVNKSWSQDYKIHQHIFPRQLRPSDLQPITSWRDKILFSAPTGSLISYNATTNVFADFNTTGMLSRFQGFEYLSSFLPLKRLEGYDSKKDPIFAARKVFTQQNYVHNFVQSTFDALSAEKIRGATLVVSGDGCNFSKDAIQIIIKMSAANGVRRVWVGQNGLLSTSALSAVIRERTGSDGSKAKGAFVLTANHNPGGPNEDFGIKYMANGPAPEGITDKIFENRRTFKEYLIAEGLPDVDISALGITKFAGPEGQFDVDVFDSTSDYVKLMKSVFDFQSIQKLLSFPKFTFCYDALHGVTGAYAKRIFVEELGAKESSLLNCTPKEDFGCHPGPNLTYANEFIAHMGLGKSNSQEEPPEFGAAADGYADRNMIFGKRFLVTPSDSVAIIAANAVHSIPYFYAGLKGVPRGMLTSAAFDVVAKHLDLKFFEVPDGWKFCGGLMDATLCSLLCGEESFGTDHICEKDGIWAVLAWLSILAYKNKESLGGEKLVSVEDIVRQHWGKYGRHYYTQYDYENVDAAAAKELMAYLVKLQSSLSEVNKIVKGIRSDVSDVDSVDEFECKGCVDGSISKHRGISYLFSDGSRLVFSLSLTGSEDTISLHIEQFEKDSSKVGRDSLTALAPLVEVALKLSKIEEFTGRSKPRVMILDDTFLKANNC